MSWYHRLLVVSVLLIMVSIPALAADSTAVTQERKTSEVMLTQEDFTKYNCENVGDALKTITGVYVNAQGEVSLRDVSASKVVVVLDGQKLNVASGSGVNVSNISIETVESIELLRGGRSAEFGADAVGGVIVITSKDQQGDAQIAGKHSFGLRGTYGSFNRQIYSLNHSYSRDRLNTIFSYRRDLWEGNFEYTDPYGARKTMINNHLNSNSVFAKMGYDLGSGNNLSTSYSYYAAHNGSPGQIDGIDGTSNILYDNHTVNLNLHMNDVYQGFNLDVGTYYLNFRTRFNDTSGVTVPIHSDHKNSATGVDIKQAGRVFDLINLSYGYTMRNDEINSTDVGSRTRMTHSAFTTMSVILPGVGPITTWESAVALRYDDPTDFASEVSPRFSLSATNESYVRTTLSAHYARSYRAPTFNDLYWPRDSFAIGNPNLNPEYGINYDVGINLSMPVANHQISTAVNYFKNDVTDLILWAQRPLDNLWEPNNISKTETWGVETSVTLALFDNLFTTNVEYTHMKALDKGPDPNRYDKYIIYRPENKLSITGTVKYSAWEWSTTYNYTGLRWTNAANTRYLPKFYTLDSNISYGFTAQGVRFNTVLELSNITDTDFQRVYLTAEPGRQYKLSLSMFL